MGIQVNIAVYVILSLVMIYKISNITDKTALLEKSFNFIFCLWVLFFSGYLITEYEEIIDSPLNEKLNWYETVTNALVVIYFILKALKNES